MAKKAAKAKKSRPARPEQRGVVVKPFDEEVIERLVDIQFHADRNADSIEAQLQQIKRALTNLADDVRKLKS
jgi:hypothetical protein